MQWHHAHEQQDVPAWRYAADQPRASSAAREVMLRLPSPPTTQVQPWKLVAQAEVYVLSCRTSLLRDRGVRRQKWRPSASLPAHSF